LELKKSIREFSQIEKPFKMDNCDTLEAVFINKYDMYFMGCCTFENLDNLKIFNCLGTPPYSVITV